MDYFARKGYLFKGDGIVLVEGDLFNEIHDAVTAKRSGRSYPSKRYVIVKVKDASLMISPGYASGQTELEMREQWTKHWNGVQTENS